MKNELVSLYEQYKKYRSEYIQSIKNENGFKNKLKKRLPNILTKSRFVAPFIIIPTSFFNLTYALIVTILFALTDAFDGYFARKYNAYSDYGRIIDPICDKVFAIGVSVPVILLNPILMITTILLECSISIINFKSSLKNNAPKSTYLGKFKTTILSLNLILNYLGTINIPLTLLTNSIQLATAINYYKIDKKKDEEKKLIIKEIENIEQEDITSDDITREKNELLELRKSLINDEKIINGRQIIKTMNHQN